MSGHDADFARQVWQRMEAIHAVTYFAPECIAANKAVGLRGFWMGYFASRAAPLGPVGAGVVEATFYNFHPSMVRRAIPDAWTFASPDGILASRRTAAAAALRAACPGVDDQAADLADRLHVAIATGVASGRPLFAANRDVDSSPDPVERLWQACTTLREHRGDGHVSVLTSSRIDGCEAHVLFAAARSAPVETHRDNRGWSADDWSAATDRLRGRGLVDGAGVTADGAALHDRVERTTDELAETAYGALSSTDREQVMQGLDRIAFDLHAADIIPFPNPMGLPAPADR